MPIIKASCASALRHAAASKTADCPVLSELRSSNIKNAERDAERVFSKYGMTVNVEMKMLSFGDLCNHPVIFPSAWMSFLAKSHELGRLVGKDPRSDVSDVLSLFWERYSESHPSHRACLDIRLGAIDSSRLLPVYIHGDEGRGKKHSNVMVLSIQSCIGIGTQQSIEKQQFQGLAEMGLNIKGSSFLTRFLFSVIHKKFYCDNPGNFHSLLELLALDLKALYDEGFVFKNHRYRVAVLGVKGDWPFLQKAGKLIRTCYNVKKKADVKTFSNGICHLCLAGRPNFPFENFGLSPEWNETLGDENPWNEPGKLLICSHDEEFPANFYKPDIFHTMHLGSAKDFAASTIAECLPLLVGTNQDDRLKDATAQLKTFCHTNHLHLNMNRFSKEGLGLTSAVDFPTACWSKGSDTTVICKWLESLLSDVVHAQEVKNSRILSLALHTVKALNMAMSELYQSNLWLSTAEAKQIADAGLVFLQGFSKLAGLCHKDNKFRYPLRPKLHICHHIFAGLLHETRCCFVLNPLSESCQMDEDFIGRTSRISRWVSPRLVALRTMQRYLNNTWSIWQSQNV
jgi:hypothetical protein